MQRAMWHGRAIAPLAGPAGQMSPRGVRDPRGCDQEITRCSKVLSRRVRGAGGNGEARLPGGVCCPGGVRSGASAWRRGRGRGRGAGRGRPSVAARLGTLRRMRRYPHPKAQGLNVRHAPLDAVGVGAGPTPEGGADDAHRIAAPQPRSFDHSASLVVISGGQWGAAPPPRAGQGVERGRGNRGLGVSWPHGKQPNGQGVPTALDT